MRPYGKRETNNGWDWIDFGNKAFSRKDSMRKNGKNNASQKRTDRAMKRRARRYNIHDGL